MSLNLIRLLIEIIQTSKFSPSKNEMRETINYLNNTLGTPNKSGYHVPDRFLFKFRTI
jgi:hypothetical protein